MSLAHHSRAQLRRECGRANCTAPGGSVRQDCPVVAHTFVIGTKFPRADFGNCFPTWQQYRPRQVTKSRRVHLRKTYKEMDETQQTPSNFSPQSTLDYESEYNVSRSSSTVLCQSDVLSKMGVSSSSWVSSSTLY